MPGSIARRGGSWVLMLYAGREDGRKRYKWITYHSFAEAQAAQRELASHVLAHSSGLGLSGSPRERLGLYLKDWVERQKPRLAPRTVERYETFSAQIRGDALGTIPLARVSPRLLEGYYGRRLAAGLSPTTVNHAHRFISKALKDAVRLDLIVQNPAAMAQPPKRTRYRPNPWGEPGILMFLSEARESSRYYPLYLFIASSGVRLGEALGLSWRNLDLREGEAFITRVFQRRRGGGVLFKEPKTDRSCREISVPAEVVGVLRDLRNRQEEDRSRSRGVCADGASCVAQGCRYWHDTDLVFTQPNGKPIHANNIRRRDLRKICTKLGLSPWRALQGLRHAHGSILHRRGMSLKEIQERMGHASAQFTLATYTHVLPGMEDNATRAVSAMLAGAPER